MIQGPVRPRLTQDDRKTRSSDLRLERRRPGQFLHCRGRLAGALRSELFAGAIGQDPFRGGKVLPADIEVDAEGPARRLGDEPPGLLVERLARRRDIADRYRPKDSRCPAGRGRHVIRPFGKGARSDVGTDFRAAAGGSPRGPIPVHDRRRSDGPVGAGGRAQNPCAAAFRSLRQLV
jgi:hypothetical protein